MRSTTLCLSYLERESDDGSWAGVGCGPDPGGVCCDAEPVCSALAPGDRFEWPLRDLEPCGCGGGTFRATFYLSENADCSQDD